MRTSSTQNGYGLKKFCYINNFSAQLSQLNHLLQGTETTLKAYEVDGIVDALMATNLNSYGCNNFHGAPIDEEHAAYKVINTGIKTASGEDIVGLFIRNKKRSSFEGVTWTTWRGIRMEITLAGKPHMGEIYFASKDAIEKAIELAKRMVQRNFKYIAPMCRPQKNGIQILMPIYLSGSYKQAPDFALVLTPEDGIYLPETILPIEGAYQNACLIAMPDEAWLKPETIFKGGVVA